MTKEKGFWMALAVLLGTFIIPEIDEAYITSRMKESGARMELQCHNDHRNCWIQVKDKRHE